MDRSTRRASTGAGVTTSPRPSRRLGLLLLLALAGAWLASTGCRAVAAARLLRDAQRPSHELAGRVEEREVLVDGLAARSYRPRGHAGALPGLLLCHGAVDSGPYDPRLVALARAFALRGLHVVCPDLPALRAFRADPAEVDLLVRIAESMARDGEHVEPDDLALVGISIGGSYCLVAAARPELAERVGTVFAFGGYDDLERLVRSWMVDPSPGVPELHDPLVEGRRRVLLGNLDGLAAPADRPALRAALRALLTGAPPPETTGLSPAGSRVLDCALSTEPIAPALADAVLAPMGPTLRALAPGRDGRAPRARVFLLHGEGDRIVPPSDADALRATLEALGTRVRVHVTGVFAHVAAGDSPSLWSSWTLVWFVGDFLAAAGA